MKEEILLVVLATLLLASCVEQKYIFKSNTISKIRNTDQEPPMGTDSLYYYDVTNGFQSRIKQKGDNIIIETVDYRNLSLSARFILPSGPSQQKIDYTNKYYYIESDYLSNTRNFKYFDTKPVLQGLSIPLKIRPKLKDPALQDSFPSQTETGFNPALAFGWKLNLNSYSPKKDIFGRNLKQFSFTPGWFLGTGAVDLKKSNTRNPIIQFERRAAIISTGAFFMFGYNNINFGYSFGWDYAMGEGRKSWLYQGKMWHGVTIGFDIIK